MDNKFFAMLFRMKHINRWGLMHALVPENLSTHSMEVAVTAHALALIGNKCFSKAYDCSTIATKALYHDLPETLTGDIPTPVKYFSDETKSAFNLLENAALKKFLNSLPMELESTYSAVFSYTSDERRIIKAADKICAYLKCVNERQLGNNEFEVAQKALKNTIDAMNCEEADYFLENFAPDFLKPIDTLLE